MTCWCLWWAHGPRGVLRTLGVWAGLDLCTAQHVGPPGPSTLISAHLHSAHVFPTPLLPPISDLSQPSISQAPVTEHWNVPSSPPGLHRGVYHLGALTTQPVALFFSHSQADPGSPLDTLGLGPKAEALRRNGQSLSLSPTPRRNSRGGSKCSSAHVGLPPMASSWAGDWGEAP